MARQTSVISDHIKEFQGATAPSSMVRLSSGTRVAPVSYTHLYGSQLQAMPPKLHSTNFPGMVLIRPLYCVREEDIIAWKRYNDLEFIQCACRFTENCTTCDNGGGGSKRQEVKVLLRRLKRDNPNIENSIFRSIHGVALDTICLLYTSHNQRDPHLRFAAHFAGKQAPYGSCGG